MIRSSSCFSSVLNSMRWASWGASVVVAVIEKSPVWLQVSGCVYKLCAESASAELTLAERLATEEVSPATATLAADAVVGRFSFDSPVGGASTLPLTLVARVGRSYGHVHD